MAFLHHYRHGPDLGHHSLPHVIQRTTVYIWAKSRPLGTSIYELKILLFAVCGLHINPVLIPDDILVIVQCSCHGIAYTWFQKFEPASKNCFYLMMY